MPFNDVFDNTGTVPLPQIVRPVPNENTGTTLGVTIMVILTDNAQLPGIGLKV